MLRLRMTKLFEADLDLTQWHLKGGNRVFTKRQPEPAPLLTAMRANSGLKILSSDSRR